MSKTVERLVYRQLVNFLERNNLLPSQCIDGITRLRPLKIASDLLLACDRGQVSLLALLDLSAAFDTVDYEILLDRLHQAFGIRGSTLEWIRSLVTGRVQTVVFAGEKSVESSAMWCPSGQCPGPDTIPSILR